MSKRNAVAYVKPAEPAFLTAFKKRAGYKEGPSIDTKREQLDLDADQEDREDERPTVVVLSPGDLSPQEADQALQQGARLADQQEEQESPNDGRIRFKKPKKRSSDEAGKQAKKKTSTSKKVNNASLLSFNEDDEEV